MSNDISADLQDLRDCYFVATRESTRKLLEAEITKLTKLIGTMADSGTSTATPAPSVPAPSVAPTSTPTPPTPLTPTPPPVSTSTYVPIDTFAFDPGEYNSKSLSIYVTSGMENVVDVKDFVSCDFTKTSFDLKVMGHGGKVREMGGRGKGRMSRKLKLGVDPRRRSLLTADRSSS